MIFSSLSFFIQSYIGEVILDQNSWAQKPLIYSTVLSCMIFGLTGLVYFINGLCEINKD
jgi:hypothetical protein